MTQDPQGPPSRGDGSLPDFTARGPQQLPDHAAAGDAAPLAAPGEKARRRSLALILSVVGSGVVLLVVVALVLSQTVFRSVLDQGDPTALPTGDRSTASGQEEYVPSEEDPDLAPPPEIFTQAPTTDCSVPDPAAPTSSPDPGTLRGGGLQYTLPQDWDYPWSSSSLPYMNEVAGMGRNVEGNWYSVVNLGRVVFPEDEGGYPGLEPAAVAIFQCYATTAGVLSAFGEAPEVTDYRTESTEVDGAPAWIVQATYHFEDPDQYDTTSASVVTAIVVETPQGPSALAGDVAADHPDHLQGLEEIIGSLEIIE